jgi:hypothetical protein
MSLLNIRRIIDLSNTNPANTATAAAMSSEESMNFQIIVVE